MELRYKVPERLRPFLEFIPMESINEMLTLALEKAIQDRSIMGKPQEVDAAHLTLLTKIEALLSERTPVRAEPPKPKPIFSPPVEEKEVAVTVEDSDEDDKLLDFLNDIMR